MCLLVFIIFHLSGDDETSLSSVAWANGLTLLGSCLFFLGQIVFSLFNDLYVVIDFCFGCSGKQRML